MPGIGEFPAVADLAPLLGDALDEAGMPAPRDVLAFTQKIVAKAEEQQVDLRTVDPGAEARARL